MSKKTMALAGMLSAALLSSSTTLMSYAAATGSEHQTTKVENGFAIPSPLIPVTDRYTLKNGLRVVLSEDHSVPVVATVIVYDVGARNEQKGRSGFAHLFEHMMFEGSENVGKTEYFKYIESTGGMVNASTHADFTNYFEKVPSNQLELALWLESDRMKSLKVTQDNFDNQLQTVKEEKRLRIDNKPYIPANLKMEEIAMDNWSNQHPVIGSFEDLDASSITDVRNFFHSHYAPNNAVLAIVGDFNPAQAKALVEKYFGTIPSHAIPPTPSLVEPVQTKEKTLTVEDRNAQMPAFWITFKADGRRQGDYYALNIIQKILSAGTSSRFYQRLVKGDQLALSAEVSYDERRGPSLFENFCIFKPTTTADKVKAVMWEELDKLKNTPVSKEELDKAKNQILRDMFSSNSYTSLQRSLGRGELLAEYTCFYGDPGLLDKDVETYLNLTPEDVQKAAQHIFKKEGATVVDVIPTANKAGEAK
ncbi:MAG TPA: pitrilysin family protein [Planktothrix sp.]